MRAFEILLERKITTAPPDMEEAAPINKQELQGLKTAIAGKIRSLPADPSTIQALREIEDLLSHVHAGGRMGYIDGQLQTIHDRTVNQAHRDLARYIYSIKMTTEESDDLFSKWRSDKLVNKKLLLSPGKHTFKELINGYNDNRAIRALTDDLARVAALGIGKGEFLLSVFSKDINKITKKEEEGAGDLKVGPHNIEVKTLDAKPGRFKDYNVKPTSSYFKTVDNFYDKMGPLLSEIGIKVAPSGVNLTQAVEIGQALAESDAKNFKVYKGFVADALKGIYPNADTTNVFNAIVNGDTNSAKQYYAQASFQNYLAVKGDVGVMFINLQDDPPSFVMVKNVADLSKIGMRLHASTAYLFSHSEQNPYPQVSVVSTKAGGDSDSGVQRARPKTAPAEQPAQSSKSMPKVAPPQQVGKMIGSAPATEPSRSKR